MRTPDTWRLVSPDTNKIKASVRNNVSFIAIKIKGKHCHNRKNFSGEFSKKWTLWASKLKNQLRLKVQDNGYNMSSTNRPPLIVGGGRFVFLSLFPFLRSNSIAINRRNPRRTCHHGLSHKWELYYFYDKASLLFYSFHGIVSQSNTYNKRNYPANHC